MIIQNISVSSVCVCLRGVEKYVLGSCVRYASLCRSSLCNYVCVLRWLLSYYSVDSVGLSIAYWCSYAPLLCELVDVDVDVEWCSVESCSVDVESLMCSLDAYTQLAYVLPRSSLNLLPKELSCYLLSENVDYHPSTCSFDWAYCNYFWECHPKLPEIPFSTLEKWNKKCILYRESLKCVDV
jgi:5'-3' exonuclease